MYLLHISTSSISLKRNGKPNKGIAPFKAGLLRPFGLYLANQNV